MMIIPYVVMVTVIKTLSLPLFQDNCPKGPHPYFIGS